METATADVTPSAPTRGNGAAPAKKLRRKFSDADKRTIIARFRKSGLGITLGARDVGVQQSVLRRWLQEAGAYKSIKKRGVHRYTDEFRRKAVAGLTDAASLHARAKKLGINKSTLYGWKKGSMAKKAAKPKKGGKVAPKRKWDFATKRAAVARLKTEQRLDVQAELGISSGMMSNWIKFVARGEKKIAKAEKKASKLALAEGRDLVTVDTMPVVHGPGNGNGKLEAVVFLREGKRVLTAAVKADRIQIDDPLLLLPMHALNSLMGRTR